LLPMKMRAGDRTSRLPRNTRPSPIAATIARVKDVLIRLFLSADAEGRNRIRPIP
jgi:hypothetical protein